MIIQVILPLKLEWEPYYRASCDLVPGQRVNVAFAHRQYVGVVSAVNLHPDTGGMHILQAEPSPLPSVLPREIAFWRELASYYLCTVGEVYKAAYPALKIEAEQTDVRIMEREREMMRRKWERLEEKALNAKQEPTREKYRVLADAFRADMEARLQALQADTTPADIPSLSAGAVTDGPQPKTLLLHGAEGKTEFYLGKARETLSQGKSVLYLAPEIALTGKLEQQIRSSIPQTLSFHSGHTHVQRRNVAQAVRSRQSTMVLGTRSALFLPHHNLGLIIVDAEHDPSHKQDSPAPRIHAREAAILLARIHGAKVILGSATPSMEALYNVRNGLFESIRLPQPDNAGILLVNTGAEMRKKGMSGSFSLMMLAQMKAALEQGGKALVVCRSKAVIPECQEELEAIFPATGPSTATATSTSTESRSRIEITTPAGIKLMTEGNYGFIGILQADLLLNREDFRSDERALQLLQQVRILCQHGLLAVQTHTPGHPVFKALKAGQDSLTFLEERQNFAYPPVTRLIDILVHDSNPRRLSHMSELLSKGIGPCTGPFPLPQEAESARMIRITLPRDKQLKARKESIRRAVEQFEKTQKYSGHISIDVDPA